jgi:hypothetical protein
MNLHQIVKTALLALGLPLAWPALATTTYSYTTGNQDLTFSGRFSVASALADGSYSFIAAANQPAGFTESFFTTSFADGRGVIRTPSLTLFDITINNGVVSQWDIRASTLFTFVTYSGGKVHVPVFHDNATLIYHDTNIPYLPADGAAYQTSIPSGDYQTYYSAGFAYQESITGLNYGEGTWSVSSTVPAVPEPESYVLLLAGLGAGVFITRRR